MKTELLDLTQATVLTRLLRVFRAHGERSARRMLLVALAAGIGAPYSARAHHSAAAFDTSQNVAIEGVVTKYRWMNPHVYMAVRTTAPDGTSREQEIEAGASSVLLPLGLTPESVKIGDAVTIRGNPSRRGPGHIVLGRELVKADGSVLPLNIATAASRKAPDNVTATSIEGTWLPPLAGLRGWNGRGGWKLTARGQAAVDAFVSTDTEHADCIPVTAPPLMLYPVASRVEVDDDVVKLHVDWMTSERVVYLDGRGHPENGERTLHGHSIGHWEGATLVVDTTQFTDHREGNAMGGLSSGPRKHLVERFSLSADGKHLDYEVQLEDPDFLAAPVTYSSRWDYRPDLTPTGLACDLEVARRFLTGE
jgi:hypothetical protein